MFSINKKIALVTILLSLCSGQFDAYGSKNNKAVLEDVVTDKQTITAPAQNTLCGIVKPNKEEIFTIAAKDEKTDPRNLRLVCREWRNIIDRLKGDTDRKYVDLHPIWQKMVRVSYGGLGQDAIYEKFLNGQLRYLPTHESEAVALPFLSLKNPFCGTFDLSTCGKRAQFIRITTSVEEFFKVRGENENRVVILISPFHSIEKRHMDKFKDVKEWKPEAPVDIFWRWGNDKDLTKYDYLTTLSLDIISAENLFENWKKSVLLCSKPGVDTWCVNSRPVEFQTSFLNPPE